jgi:glycosyltransferase involved in cell wall biosynthesis
MRIAHVIGRLGIGGAERHFVNLLNALDDCDRVAILVSPPAHGPALEHLLDPRIEVLRHPVRKSRLSADMVGLAQRLRERSLDVVHCHMFWASCYGSVAARLAGVPVVVTTEHGENRWKRGWHRWIERRIISPRVDRRFCVSPAILARRRDDEGIPASKLELMPNGVPLPDLAARETGPVPVIGAVGRFVPEKAFDRLVEAAALLRDRSLEFRLVIIGDGPELLAVQERVVTLGLEGRVGLPGYTTDVNAQLAKMDIFASSSIQEGLPVALLEAMSWGLPIVATDVGAVASAVGVGAGKIVAPGDPTALAAALEELLASQALRAALGAAARRRVEREFSIASIARRHRDTYRSLLAARPTPQAGVVR